MPYVSLTEQAVGALNHHGHILIEDYQNEHVRFRPRRSSRVLARSLALALSFLLGLVGSDPVEY